MKPTLTLSIDGSDYRCVSLCGGGWRVVGMDRRGAYDLAVDGDRVTCTCGDYVHRQAATGGRCKHGAAAVAVGLLIPSNLTATDTTGPLPSPGSADPSPAEASPPPAGAAGH